MRSFTAALLVAMAMLSLASAYYLDDTLYGDDAELRDDDSSIRELFKRGRNICLPWRAPCPPEASTLAKYPILNCCSGLICKCTFMNSNCKCQGRLGWQG